MKTEKSQETCNQKYKTATGKQHTKYSSSLDIDWNATQPVEVGKKAYKNRESNKTFFKRKRVKYEINNTSYSTDFPSQLLSDTSRAVMTPPNCHHQRCFCLVKQ
jgi:hypothetical protein